MSRTHEHQSRKQRIQGALSQFFSLHPPSTASQAFIDLLSTQLSSDVARLIKDLKTQAEEAVREAEKFDKIRADFTGTVQKIEVNAELSLF